MTYYSNLRKERIHQIHEEIKDKDEPVPRSQIEAEACYEFGVKKETVDRMVQILIDAGKIEETSDGLIG